MIRSAAPSTGSRCPHTHPATGELDARAFLACPTCLHDAQVWGLHSGLLTSRWRWEAAYQHLNNTWEHRYFTTREAAGEWLLTLLKPDGSRAQIVRTFLETGQGDLLARTPRLVATVTLAGREGDVCGSLLNAVAGLLGLPGVKGAQPATDIRMRMSAIGEVSPAEVAASAAARAS